MYCLIKLHLALQIAIVKLNFVSDRTRVGDGLEEVAVRRARSCSRLHDGRGHQDGVGHAVWLLLQKR